jgi:hypothetical protein
MKEKFPVAKGRSRHGFVLTVLGILLSIFLYLNLFSNYEHQEKCPFEPPTSKPFFENRQRLQQKLQGLNSSLILLGSAPESSRPGSDMLSDWRQTSNIMYVMGRYEIAGSLVLINATCENLCLSLFLPVKEQKDVVFYGGVPDKAYIKDLYRLDNVYDVTELSDLVGSRKLLSPDLDILDMVPSAVQKTLRGGISYSPEVEQAFVESRFVKSNSELEYLRFAGLTAHFTHKKIEEAIGNWKLLTESTLASYFSYYSTICYCRLQAYSPIVGAGKHAAVLHFRPGQSFDAGYSKISPKEFILIDASGSYDGYASDLTRTYSKKKTEKYHELLKIVGASQKAGLKAHVEGNMVYFLNIVVRCRKRVSSCHDRRALETWLSDFTGLEYSR